MHRSTPPAQYTLELHDTAAGAKKGKRPSITIIRAFKNEQFTFLSGTRKTGDMHFIFSKYLSLIYFSNMEMQLDIKDLTHVSSSFRLNSNIFLQCFNVWQWRNGRAKYPLGHPSYKLSYKSVAVPGITCHFFLGQKLSPGNLHLTEEFKKNYGNF